MRVARSPSLFPTAAAASRGERLAAAPDSGFGSRSREADGSVMETRAGTLRRRAVGGRALVFFAMAAPQMAAAPLSAAPGVGPSIPAPSPTPVAPRQARPGFEVQGIVVDSTGAGLRNAMVVALARPDSVLVEHTLSSGDGRFVLADLPAGAYVLQITLIGYRTLRRDFAVANGDVDAGSATLSVAALEMDPVVVSVEHVPFLKRGDTTSYNALAFPTPPNATVEDLLRRLPGIRVDADGTITVQGRSVAKLLVDGKEFFGDDPTIATQNLPADAIQRVAVYDKKSDMAEFTGIPDGREERTIDLKLKEEARNGYFGRVRGDVGGDAGSRARLIAPSGNQARYNGSLSLNRFSPTVQLALVASANNVNRGRGSRGFADLAGGVSAGGEGAGEGGSSGGFAETMSLGLNGSREFGENTWVRGSYSARRLDNAQDRTLRQRALLGSGAASRIDQTRSRNSGNVSHRLNLSGQIAFSEGHDLRVRLSGTGRASSFASFASRKTRTLGGSMLSSATTDYLADGNELSGDGRLTWRRRLNEEGRSLVAELSSDIERSDAAADLSSQIFEPRRDRDDEDGVRKILQEQSRAGRTRSHSARLSLTQPLGEGHTLELFGQRNAILQDRDNSVHDLIDGAPVFNAGASSGFERAYAYFRGGTRYSRNFDRSWLALGLRLQRSRLDGVVRDRDESVATGYTHLLGSVELEKELTEKQTVHAEYRGSSREPSLAQLQPFADNADPLDVRSGNPHLRPEYEHQVMADYAFFDEATFVIAFGSLAYTANSISQSRVFDERGLQTRMPVNAGGKWSSDLGAGFGIPIRRLGIDLEIGYLVSWSEGIELVNLEANESRIMGNSLEIGIGNREKDRFDLSASTTLDLNNVAYSLNRELNRSYVNARYRAEAIWHPNDEWTLESTLQHRVFDPNLFGETRNVARWDAGISRRTLGGRIEIELRAHDLLNQNQGVDVASSASRIEESRTDSLGRYFMLRAMYRLGTPTSRKGPRGKGR